jgi:hypothetical protein
LSGSFANLKILCRKKNTHKPLYWKLLYTNCTVPAAIWDPVQMFQENVLDIAQNNRT